MRKKSRRKSGLFECKMQNAEYKMGCQDGPHPSHPLGEGAEQSEADEGK